MYPSRYTLSKTTTEVLFTLSAGLCGKGDCMAFLTLLDNAYVPLPVCFPNGTIHWPKVNITEYFSLAAMKDKLKEAGKDLAKNAVQSAVGFALDQLGLPSVS